MPLTSKPKIKTMRTRLRRTRAAPTSPQLSRPKPGIKRAATRVMPTVKKAAKVAPIVTPAANPYILKAVAKAKEVAPEVAQAAKAVASGAQTGAKTATGHIRTTAPKLGHAAAGKV